MFEMAHTGTTEDSGDLDELDWDPSVLLSDVCHSDTLIRRTHLAESMFALCESVCGVFGGDRVELCAARVRRLAARCGGIEVREIRVEAAKSC